MTPARAMNEISRVLRPSGTLIVIVPMRYGYTTDSTHRIFYGPGRLRKIAKEHHYDVQSIFIFPIPWEFLGNYFFLRISSDCAEEDSLAGAFVLSPM